MKVGPLRRRPHPIAWAAIARVNLCRITCCSRLKRRPTTASIGIRQTNTRLNVRGHRFFYPASRAVSSSRSEEHTSELQSLMRISYAVFCLKKKNIDELHLNHHTIRSTVT